MKTTTSSSASSTSSHALNSLVHGTKVEGVIESDNDIRVDGAIKGTLKCKAKVIIGPKGLIEGEIHAQNAVIEGRFEGILAIAEVLHIKEQARVTGEISAAKLVVQPGAVINGSFDMGGGNSKKANGNNALQAGKEKVKLANPVGK
ncbi:MAG: polymer-forming cytoskeletal protein [Bacteroidota bacterium]